MAAHPDILAPASGLRPPAAARQAPLRQPGLRPVHPGTGLIADPTVYWASWGIDAVARMLDADPALREWIAPRPVPFVVLAASTLGASLFTHQHPDVDELFALTDQDRPGPRLMPLIPREHRARLSARVRHTLVRPEDYQVALTDFTAGPARPRAVRSADALVEERDGALVVRLPDGAVFPAIDVFSHVLTTLSMDLFQPLRPAAHTARVTVDRLVIAREAWQLPAAEAAFADDKDEARRFVRARHWRTRLGLPRFVFVVSPTESRPFYVDFDSPVYVTILAKALRRLVRKDPSATATFTEMLPTPEQTWLTDDKDHRYTSELRFVAYDTRGE
ncbi:lantibiotic dehydratase [Streptomyces althioticus]|uniref:lantibiotic dehydratase n=1 Tax=Streptomyces althioticus TaxID=83380 RepID=UPI0033FF0974